MSIFKCLTMQRRVETFLAVLFSPRFFPGSIKKDGDSISGGRTEKLADKKGKPISNVVTQGLS